MTMVFDCGWWWQCIIMVSECNWWRECIIKVCDGGRNV